LRGYETLRTGHDNFKGLLGELSLDVVLELGARAFHPSVALHDGVKATILCAQKESAQPGHVFFYQNLATEDSYDAKVAVLRDAARADLGVPIVQSKWQESGTSAMLLGASDLPLSLRRATTTVAQRADVVVGIQTSDDARYVKYVWQIPAGQSGWRIHSKGGGYARWYGLNRWVIDWERGSREFFKTDNARIVAEQWADKEGWSYTWFANGALGVRAKAAGWTFGRAAASGVFSEDTRVIAFLNSRFASVASQAIGGKVQLPEGIVRALPMPQTLAAISPELVSLARIIKRDLTRSDMREADYDPALLRDPWQELWLEALVLVIEGILERQVERCLEMTTETSEQWGNVHGYPVAWLTPSAEVLSHPFWGLMSTDVEDYRTVLQRDTESMPESGRAQLFSSFKICMLKQGATGYPRRYVMPSTGIVEHLARLHQAHPFDVVCAIRDGIEESSPAVRDIGSAHLCARITAEILRCLGHRWWNAAETTPRETVLKLNCGDLSSIVERCIEHPFQRQLLGPCVSTWIKRVLIPWQNKRFFGASPLSYREIAGKEFYCERMSFVPEAERDEKAVGLG
jgi:hypothetical protein